MTLSPPTVTLLLVLSPMASLAQTPAPAPPLTLINANVIDGVSAQPIRRATVVIREGRIASVEPTGTAPPPDVTVVDLQGKWLLPGLIDAHVHPADLAAARVALRSGVTTIRTGSSRRFVDIGIRDLHRAGFADLPDVIASGHQVVRQLPETFFLDFPKMTDLMSEVRGPENVRRLVRALAGRGVDVIKVLATERGGLVQSELRRQMFADEELVSIVDEAKGAGLSVMAHAHGAEGADAAVRAGVRSIEHGTYLRDDTLALMRERGTFLVPTLTVGMRENADPILEARSRAVRPRRREMVARAIKAGVRIVTGTDVEYADQYRLQDEIVELVRLGLSPLAAIKAGTSMAAECLTINARTGSIRAGFEADLIVVERDPLQDIEVIRDVLLVVNNGTVVINRLQPLDARGDEARRLATLQPQ